ncbi:hypothetical protein EGW08_010707, partial [Elysia chlorotica]
FHCEICGKGCFSRQSLAFHMKGHEGKRYACTICNHRFTLKHHLTRHTTTVHGLRQCSSCLGVFNNSDQLNQHVEHCSNKPFACHICGNGFLTYNGFTIHMKSHEGRKFMCSICDSKFFQKAHLKAHLNKIHKMVQCIYCLKLFSLGSDYNQHVLHCPS